MWYMDWYNDTTQYQDCTDYLYMTEFSELGPEWNWLKPEQYTWNSYDPEAYVESWIYWHGDHHEDDYNEDYWEEDWWNAEEDDHHHCTDYCYDGICYLECEHGTYQHDEYPDCANGHDWNTWSVDCADIWFINDSTECTISYSYNQCDLADFTCFRWGAYEDGTPLSEDCSETFNEEIWDKMDSEWDFANPYADHSDDWWLNEDTYNWDDDWEDWEEEEYDPNCDYSQVVCEYFECSAEEQWEGEYDCWREECAAPCPAAVSECKIWHYDEYTMEWQWEYCPYDEQEMFEEDFAQVVRG